MLQPLPKDWLSSHTAWIPSSPLNILRTAELDENGLAWYSFIGWLNSLKLDTLTTLKVAMGLLHLFFQCVYAFCLHVCLYTCVYSAQRDQKGELDPVGLEVQMVLNCHVGAENRTWILWKRSQCAELLSHFFSP